MRTCENTILCYKN